VIERQKRGELEKRRDESSEKGLLNWSPKFSYFKYKFFLAATRLVTLEGQAKIDPCGITTQWFPREPSGGL